MVNAMEDKETRSLILRNRFLEEMKRYESVFGGLDVTTCDAMEKAADTMNKRIHSVIDHIKSLYEEYNKHENQEQAFNTDYPHLAPVIKGLSKLTAQEHIFDINDLKDLSKKISRANNLKTEKEKPSKTTSSFFKRFGR